MPIRGEHLLSSGRFFLQKNSETSSVLTDEFLFWEVRRMKIIMITGFLCSGKTTLMQNILCEYGKSTNVSACKIFRCSGVFRRSITSPKVSTFILKSPPKAICFFVSILLYLTLFSPRTQEKPAETTPVFHRRKAQKRGFLFLFRKPLFVYFIILLLLPV